MSTWCCSGGSGGGIQYVAECVQPHCAEARKKAAAAAARRLGDKVAQDTADDFDQDEVRKKKSGRGDLKKIISKTRGTSRRRSGKVTISEALAFKIC